MKFQNFLCYPSSEELKQEHLWRTKCLKNLKGNWEIRTLLKNETAQQFWRNIIRSFSNDEFEEKYIRNNSRLAFYFESK